MSVVVLPVINHIILNLWTFLLHKFKKFIIILKLLIGSPQMLFDILCILLKFIAVHLICDLHIIPVLLTNKWWRISWAIGLGVPGLFSIFPLSCVAEAWDYSCVFLMSIAVLEKMVYILPYRQSTKSSSCLRKLGLVTNEKKYLLQKKKKIIEL